METSLHLHTADNIQTFTLRFNPKTFNYEVWTAEVEPRLIANCYMDSLHFVGEADDSDAYAGDPF